MDLTVFVCFFLNMAVVLLQSLRIPWCYNLQVLGMPPNDFVQSASRRRLFFGENFSLIRSIFHCLITYCVYFIVYTVHWDCYMGQAGKPYCVLVADSKGNPRNITNSKGKKRRPNSKELSAALKTNDALFLDFIKSCLTYVTFTFLLDSA